MTVRFYSSTATEKALVGSITSGQTTLQVNNTVGLPTSFPYSLAVDYEGPTEELVEVSSAAGPVLTIVRGIDGTSAASHADNARVRHTSSARDFADSRSHENSSTNIHGLTGGEEIVGTNKVQTLTNKTVVNLLGTLQDPDITLTGTNVTTFTRTPAGVAADAAVTFVSGVEEAFSLRNNGALRVRNTAVLDTATTTRRISTTMADGTTERFRVEAGGQVTALPRAGTVDGNAGFKVVDPEDSLNRRIIKIMDPTDAIERFTIDSGGTQSMHTRDPNSISLFIQQAAAPTVSSILVQDSTANNLFTVDLNGVTNANRRLFVGNNAAASIVSQVRAAAAQTADLQQWQNSGGVALARVRSNGSGDFTPVVTTTGIFTAAAGWSVTSQVAVVKAGVATINLALLRTGATIVADAGGDLFGDPALGTLSAAFRPHSAFAPSVLTGAASNGLGTGSWFLNPTSGDMNIQTWSTNNEILSGINLRVTMTFPLEFA
jgi:hypothetical protein